MPVNADQCAGCLCLPLLRLREGVVCLIIIPLVNGVICTSWSSVLVSVLIHQSYTQGWYSPCSHVATHVGCAGQSLQRYQCSILQPGLQGTIRSLDAASVSSQVSALGRAGTTLTVSACEHNSDSGSTTATCRTIDTCKQHTTKTRPLQLSTAT